jgi:NAD(P) transhydrogenase
VPQQRQRKRSALLPYGIYSVPEISMVGKIEEELTEEGVSTRSAGAVSRDCAGPDHRRHHLAASSSSTAESALLGCTSSATAPASYSNRPGGLAFNGTIDYFINTVFNYPTLAECYRLPHSKGSTASASVSI